MYYKSAPEAVSPQVFATSFQSRVMWVAGGSVGGLLYIQPRPIYARGGLPIISISFPRTPALKGVHLRAHLTTETYRLISHFYIHLTCRRYSIRRMFPATVYCLL